MRLIRWIIGYFKVTHEWCVCIPMGSKFGAVRLVKCRGGVPVGSGWFVDYIKFGPSFEDMERATMFLADVYAEMGKGQNHDQ